ncbi:MAG: alpha/beta fold hydrolase [Pseudooceanicola sp.]
MGDITVEGARAHWREIGKGPERALAVHCSLAHSGAWTGLGEEMGDRLTIRAFDLPGHGGSDDWDERVPYQDLACATGRALMGDGPVHLIGHSFGATVALRLAVEAPESVASLTLIETVFFTIVRQDRPEAVEDSDRLNSPFARAMEAGDLAAAARAFHGTWGDGRKWDEMTDRQRDGLTRRMPLIAAVQASNNGDPLNMLAERKLEQLDLPVLLVEGGDSPPHIALINDGLERRLPRTRRAVIPGAAHMVPITHPAETARALRGFLDDLPQGSSASMA